MEFYSRNEDTSDTWITPRKIVVALGPFDLDPCTPEEGMPYKSARRMIKPSECGLCTKWEGRVWLNPPYKGPESFLMRMSLHGNGIALLAARTGSAWFQNFVFKTADALFFAQSRIKFTRIDGTGGHANFDSVFAAWGNENVKALSRLSMKGYTVRLK